MIGHSFYGKQIVIYLKQTHELSVFLSGISLIGRNVVIALLDLVYVLVYFLDIIVELFIAKVPMI